MKKTPLEIYEQRAAQADFCHMEEVSSRFIVCLILLEDSSFFCHNGVNGRMIYESLRQTAKGSGHCGGSTITQQLVKNLYFRFDPTIRRKVREMFLARRFERSLTKVQILELYMNVIYFDNGQYGIHNASRFYFGKRPSELDLNQSFFLASLLPVVGIYNPLYHPEKFAAYRDKKLSLLADFASDDLLEQIRRHGPELLDEELCSPCRETDVYNRRGPMINERFGPGGPDCLL